MLKKIFNAVAITVGVSVVLTAAVLVGTGYQNADRYDGRDDSLVLPDRTSSDTTSTTLPSAEEPEFEIPEIIVPENEEVVYNPSFFELAPYMNCLRFEFNRDFAQNTALEREQAARQALEYRYDDPDLALADYYTNFDGALCKDLAYLDGIRTNGLTEQEYELHKDFQENFLIDSSYAEWEAEKLNSVIDNLQYNPGLQNALEEWKPQSEFRNSQEAEEQYNLRLQVSQIVSDEMRAVFGYEPIDIQLINFENADLEGNNYKAGEFASDSNGNKVININYDPEYGVTDSLEETLNILIHEVKHSIDYEMLTDFINGRIHFDDIEGAHAVALLANYQVYAAPETDGIRSYEMQYVERSAYDADDEYSSVLVDRLEAQLKGVGAMVPQSFIMPLIS